VDIFPTEKIKYAKETQTVEKLLLLNGDPSHGSETEDEVLPKNQASGPDLNNNVNSNDHNHQQSAIKLSKKKRNDKKAAAQLKPLAFYEDVFVYDTFQWEDEFTHHDHDDESSIKQSHSQNEKHSTSTNHDLNDQILSPTVRRRMANNHDAAGENYHKGDTTFLFENE
jgi:hypothetical protein